MSQGKTLFKKKNHNQNSKRAKNCGFLSFRQRGGHPSAGSSWGIYTPQALNHAGTLTTVLFWPAAGGAVEGAGRAMRNTVTFSLLLLATAADTCIADGTNRTSQTSAAPNPQQKAVDAHLLGQDCGHLLGLGQRLLRYQHQLAALTADQHHSCQKQTKITGVVSHSMLGRVHVHAHWLHAEAPHGSPGGIWILAWWEDVEGGM